MRISHKHKFVFIAPPKTGSTTLRRVFDPYSDVAGSSNGSEYYYHMSPEKFKKYFNKNKWNWDEYFKFAFVRNPWSRVVSMYEYRNLKSRDNTRFGRKSLRLLKQIKNFEDFVRKGHSGTPCYHWCFDASGNQLVDFIGKVENLQEDFNTVCDKIGIPKQKLPHRNKTKHKHYTEYYDDETKQIIAEKYAKDIEYLGYEFGE